MESRVGSPALRSACFDSDVLVDYLQRVPQAVEEFRRYDEHHLSIVSRIEILTGAVHRGVESQVREFISECNTHELTHAIADRAYMLRVSHRLRTPDAAIWATALHLGLVLVTRNTRDFPADDPTIRVPYQL